MLSAIQLEISQREETREWGRGEIEASSLVYLPADCRKILDSRHKKGQKKNREKKAGQEQREQVSSGEKAVQRAGAVGQSQFPLVVALPAFTYTQFSISAVCLKRLRVHEEGESGRRGEATHSE